MKQGFKNATVYWQLNVYMSLAFHRTIGWEVAVIIVMIKQVF